MKITQKQLKEMVQKLVKAKLKESFYEYGTATMADLGPQEHAAIAAWLEGDLGDLPGDLLNKLTYIHHEEMPYGVQKGRTGTPEEWLLVHLDRNYERPLTESNQPKTVKITIDQLKEMINHAVKDKLNEAPSDIPDKWVKYMKSVEDMLKKTVDDAKKLHEEGETLKAEEREKDTVANPGDATRKGHYAHVDERSEALKDLTATLSRKLEVWKTKY